MIGKIRLLRLHLVIPVAVDEDMSDYRVCELVPDVLARGLRLRGEDSRLTIGLGGATCVVYAREERGRRDGAHS